ncbi:MAG: hypothetical protein ACJAVI_003034 [Candidatus Azotimanducaceae bacterium]|jgi:hypothetical protein
MTYLMPTPILIGSVLAAIVERKTSLAEQWEFSRTDKLHWDF